MLLRLLASLALILLLPLPGNSQLVRGRLLNGETGLPLEGAMVVLQGTQGEAGAVLSNAAGRFLLRAPGPGTYTVRADRIGHASTHSEAMTLAAGDTVDIELVAEIMAIRLEGLEVSGEARCDVRPEAGRVVATVWEEARKALSAAALTDEAGYYRYRTIRFRRDLDDGGRRILSEQRRASQGYLTSPFESLPAEVLMREGFIKSDPEGDLYYAPDASVLLSDEFLDTHCLGVQAGRGDREGLLGVLFEPISGRETPDIRGVVWVTPETGELSHVDYTYENLDPALRHDMVGGEVAFQGLPNGTWIVREWRIRMPNASLAPDFRGSRQVILTGFREVGGEVDRVQDQRGNTILEAQRATLVGTVFDSTGVSPLSGARVTLRGTQASAVTDAEGRFSLTGLSEGVYSVGFSHSGLPEFGESSEGPEVSLTPGEVTSIALVTPPLSQFLTAVCGEGRPEDSAVLTGRVLDGETGTPLPGATVRVLWRDYRFRGTQVAGGSAGRWRTMLGMQEEGLQGESDGEGRYLACGVPRDHPLRVEGESGGLTSGIQAVRVPPGEELLAHDLTIVRSGSGSVVGLVVDLVDQGPLEGARITLSDLGLETLSDESGRFHLGDIPLGRHVLEAELLGRKPLLDTIQIRPDRPLQLEVRLPPDAVALEGITVEVFSTTEMEMRTEGYTGARVDRITPEQMDELRDRVGTIVDVIRQMGSPRIRITDYGPQGFPLGFCMTWTRRQLTVGGNREVTDPTAGNCPSMLLVLDGHYVGGGPREQGTSFVQGPSSGFILGLDPEEIESVRVLSPVQAQFRFGSQGVHGALIIETRRGGREGSPS